MSDEEILNTLKQQIEITDSKTEIKCGNLLLQISWILLTKSHNLTYVPTEQRLSGGRLDFAVIAESEQPGGYQLREAYIWELKAPQYNLFEVKTGNHAVPSKELYSAETQLFHYCYCLSKDYRLLKIWNLSPENIKFGGVIIGRDNNFVDLKGKEEILGKGLAIEANNVRNIYLYNPLSIKLWTWDQVIKIAESQLYSHKKYDGDPRKAIDPRVSEPYEMIP